MPVSLAEKFAEGTHFISCLYHYQFEFVTDFRKTDIN